MVRGWKPWATVAVLALLAACGGPRHAPRPGPTPPVQPTRPPPGGGLVNQRIDDRTMDRIGQAVGNYQQCYAELAAARVEFSPMPDRDDGTGCAYADAGLVTVDWGTVARLNPAQPLLSCPAALALSIWRRQVVEPAARDIFGSDVVQIDLMGAYSCRNVNGAATGRRSAHARANALDFGGVRLRNGRRITVVDGWSAGGDEARFLRRVRDESCRIYGTVLSPDYNAAHRDHLHLEIREATWTMCR
jgi:hypothetical protein